MQKYSIFSLIKNAFSNHQNWDVAWRNPEPKREYDVIIIGGGGHGLTTAYYLAKNHGLKNIAVIEKGWIGGGNTGRNTTIIRSNYLWDESAAIYDHALKLWENMSQELNFNVMFSQRGVLNLAHNLHDVRELKRRWNANRLNNIDSSSDIYPTTDYVSSELTEGDQNAAIYITKQVTLENLATSLKVLFAAHRPASNDIKVMYKILGADESVDFQSLGYRYFNSDGSSDTTIQPSADVDDFQEYVYTAGVTDDGIGDSLTEFISFQIKIIMQGTNTSTPPRIKDLRVLALAT